MKTPIAIVKEIEIGLEISDIADAFAAMTDDEQARFFVLVAQRFGEHTEHGGVPGMQTYAIGRHLATCDCANNDAREFLREIVSAMDSRPS